MFDLVQTIDFGTDHARQNVVFTDGDRGQLVELIARFAERTAVRGLDVECGWESGSMFAQYRLHGRVTRWAIEDHALEVCTYCDRPADPNVEVADREPMCADCDAWEVASADGFSVVDALSDEEFLAEVARMAGV